MRVDYSEQGKITRIDRRTGVFGESEVVNLLNLRIGAEWDNWRLDLFARNLLDERDAQDPFAYATIESRPRPRTIGVKVAWDLD